jgi:hypothetical protein
MLKCFLERGSFSHTGVHLISTVGEAELDRPAFPVPAGPVGSDSQLRLQGIKVRSTSVAPFPDRSRPGKTTSHQAKTSRTAGATTTNRASRIRNYNVKDGKLGVGCE